MPSTRHIARCSRSLFWLWVAPDLPGSHEAFGDGDRSQEHPSPPGEGRRSDRTSGTLTQPRPSFLEERRSASEDARGRRSRSLNRRSASGTYPRAVPASRDLPGVRKKDDIDASTPSPCIVRQPVAPAADRATGRHVDLPGPARIAGARMSIDERILSAHGRELAATLPVYGIYEIFEDRPAPEQLLLQL